MASVNVNTSYIAVAIFNSIHSTVDSLVFYIPK